MNDRELEALRGISDELRLLKNKLAWLLDRYATIEEDFENRITELEMRCSRSEGLLSVIERFEITTEPLENTDAQDD